ncbi:MAG: DUF559 domain-containing protein [Actinomycetales bacterium]|uniref:DUF559 domain-containing protein n=1 Tax=Candidatus Phosphoribacter hodrii TaxID=2953743 RepID=A0A934X4W5_9MICO|nr:DUF559 domain-containing protein [Candidatus Phosphoribacter hodrii]OPZ55319.1 MAG: hypothetical protein BWY91_01109 [bacterium ADurb.BinA028]HOA02543.1 DUF559 domain-containing protein [Dermatophilaceae bacterium]MBK7273199.1 DUF559 domain-containing protein [Candidatus Phosphoribacter hodrii]MBL0005313.1 DUF559 domain-containing protein [Candidatus Phosphoribacter hodrii]
MTSTSTEPAARRTPIDLRLDRPFRRRDALLAGLTDEDLRGPRFRRLLHGIYISAAVEITPRIRVLAAMRTTTHPCFASHHTAATLLGATVPDSAWTHLGTTEGAMSVRRQVKLRRYAVPPALAPQSPLPCTDAAQTFLDLARCLELVDLVVLGDGLVRQGHITAPALLKAARQHEGPGAALARLAAGYVRPGVDSPMETRVRMLFVLAGFPEPVVNVEVFDDAGRLRYRIDLAWPSAKVAVEYDGRHHINRQDQWTYDIRRREELEAEGWRFLVLTAPDIYRTPGTTLDRAESLLAAGGLRVRRRPDWFAHFPSQPSLSA